MLSVIASMSRLSSTSVQQFDLLDVPAVNYSLDKGNRSVPHKISRVRKP